MRSVLTLVVFLIVSISGSRSDSNVTDFELFTGTKSIGIQHPISKADKSIFGGSYWESLGEFDGSTCKLSKGLKFEIKGYEEIVELILIKAIKGAFRGETFKHLAHFTDYFGPRLVSSPDYYKASAFFTRQFANIPTLNGRMYGESVDIPDWQRVTEFAEILTPVKKYVDIFGLGLTIGTNGALEGDAIVVDSLEELRLNKYNIGGKILVLNLNFDETQKIITTAASRGSSLGALAVLIRSPTQFSIYSIHAALLTYNSKVPKIPAATITVEDGELLSRLYKKGKRVTLRVIMENTGALTTIKSNNIIADFEGREMKDDYVIVSGNMDSWDIGQGATDAVGALLTYELARMFDDLKLYPRRTVRTILWTGSKFGHLGALKYIDNHESDIGIKYSAVLGSNLGCFEGKGFIFSGSPQAACIINEILRLFPASLIGKSASLIHVNGTVSDVSHFSVPSVGISSSPAGVPSLTLNGDDGRFHWYADSAGDTVSPLESEQLDICLGMYTAMTYVLADLTDKLPK